MRVSLSIFFQSLLLPKTSFDPTNSKVNFLNALISVCFLYNVVLLPYSSVFFWTFGKNTLAFQILNIISDLIYFIDFTTARMFQYVDSKTGHIINDPSKCQWHYFCSFQFKIDILANLPIEWMYGSIIGRGSDQARTIFRDDFNESFKNL